MLLANVVAAVMASSLLDCDNLQIQCPERAQFLCELQA